MLNAEQVQDVIYQGLPAASEEGLRVEEVGERRARLRSPFRPSTIRPGGTLSGPTMMGLADAAMYAAKRAGRNKVVKYTPDIKQVAQTLIKPNKN